MLYAVLEVLLSLLAVFGLFVLGYLTFSRVLSPGRAAAPAYAVVPAKGDGAALEQTVKRLLWLRTGAGQCYTVVIADAIFIYCAAAVFRDPHRAQKFAKIAMVVALVSFILGVFRF